MKKIDNYILKVDTIIMIFYEERNTHVKFKTENSNADYWVINSRTFDTRRIEDIDCLTICRGGGYVKYGPNYYKTRKNIYSYFIIYTISGKMRFKYGKKTFVIKPGSLVFAKMSVEHEFQGYPDCGWEAYYFHAMIPDIFYEYNEHFNIIYNDFSPKEMKKEIELILKEISKNDKFDSISFNKHFYSILFDFVSQFRKSAKDNKSNNLTMLIRLNLGKPIREIANNYGYSEEHFIRKFKEKNGMTPKSYMNEIMIEKARKLILLTDISFDDIFHDCGFKNSRNFYYAFKKYCGISPEKLRKNKSELKVMNHVGL